MSLKLKGNGSINHSVLTVDDLANISNPEVNDICIVTDENRGGTFVYRGTGDDNGGTIFSGWHRQYDGAVNVKWFGAKVDGITDDAVAIQAAIDYTSTSVVKTIKIISNNVTIKSPIYGKNNVTILNEGRLYIPNNIDENLYNGAIIVDTISNFSIIGGIIETTDTSYANNIIYVKDSSDCVFSNIQFKDVGLDRYPLGCIRSQNNTRNKYSNNEMINIKGIGIQTAGDDFTRVDSNIIVTTGEKSPLETNNGSQNYYTNNTIVCESNLSTSALSFNDQKSICSNNLVKGGLHGITTGHNANTANDSIVSNNIIQNPSHSGINIQYTDRAIILGNNITHAGINGILSDDNSSLCTVSNNIIEGTMTVGIKSSDKFVVSNNIVRGATINYRNVAEDDINVLTGNIALNGTYGFDWGTTANQKNALVVGNFAGDDQGTPTLSVGFRVNNVQNLFLGNATDGNATYREFSYTGGTGLGVLTLPSSAQKDFSSATKITTPYTDGISGGTGSAGAGNQYIKININGTNYKILHDGTV